MKHTRLDTYLRRTAHAVLVRRHMHERQGMVPPDYMRLQAPPKEEWKKGEGVVLLQGGSRSRRGAGGRLVPCVVGDGVERLVRALRALNIVIHYKPLHACIPCPFSCPPAVATAARQAEDGGGLALPLNGHGRKLCGIYSRMERKVRLGRSMVTKLNSTTCIH